MYVCVCVALLAYVILIDTNVNPVRWFGSLGCLYCGSFFLSAFFILCSFYFLLPRSKWMDSSLGDKRVCIYICVCVRFVSSRGFYYEKKTVVTWQIELTHYTWLYRYSGYKRTIHNFPSSCLHYVWPGHKELLTTTGQRSGQLAILILHQPVEKTNVSQSYHKKKHKTNGEEIKVGQKKYRWFNVLFGSVAMDSQYDWKKRET